MRRMAMLAAALLLVSGCAGTSTDGAPDAAAPADAADAAAQTDAAGPDVAESADGDGPLHFTAQTLDGDDFDAATALGGQPTVLWFWAPWCTICRTEAPEVTAVAAELEGEVSFVGVAGRGEEAAMRDFVEETGTGGLEHVVDADGSIWTGFGVIAQPAYAFIDVDGQVEVFAGALPPDELRAMARALSQD